MGIGTRVNQDTLREIAGKNGDVIIVKNFDLLVTQLMEIKNKICGRLSSHINREFASNYLALSKLNRIACFKRRGQARRVINIKSTFTFLSETNSHV